MKRITLSIVFLFTVCSVYSQSFTGKVTYDMHTSLPSPTAYNASLYFTNQQSMFQWLTKQNETDIKEDEYGNMSIVVVTEDSIGNVSFKDFKKDSLYTRTLWLDKKYIIYESIPEIKWQLHAETKQIGKFTCNKATGEFRGRTYTAWYSLDIPISTGPWKLHGLPGLILEAHDEGKEVQFIFNSIEIPYDYEIKTGFLNEGKRISIKEFAIKQQELGDEIFKIFASKIDARVQVTMDEVTYHYIEKEFEFESDKDSSDN